MVVVVVVGTWIVGAVDVVVVATFVVVVPVGVHVGVGHWNFIAAAQSVGEGGFIVVAGSWVVAVVAEMVFSKNFAVGPAVRPLRFRWSGVFVVVISIVT